jgi:Zn-dependent M28 family amino/carboxypeptidase
MFEQRAGETSGRLLRKLQILLGIALATAIVSVVSYMVAMPQSSYAGALKSLTDDERLSAENLRRHVVSIASREHNLFHPSELEAAARHIEVTLSGLGYETAAQRFVVDGTEVRNIEVEVAGGTGEVDIIGAHSDSVSGAVGANDNGSGVAAVLELARLFRDARPARTVRFVAFVNEEPPFYRSEQMGSRLYARRSRERRDNIVAMLSLETIGYYSNEPGSQRYPFPLRFFYPSTGNFLAFVADLGSRGLLHEALESFRRHAHFPSEGVAAPAFIPGVDWSDHWSFWQESYPALMVTDTAPYRYPHYHTLQDTPDKVDYERLARVVSGLHGMLRDLAHAPPRR